MVGLFAEPCPRGFGFSDTAFRIFILMATRRLQSDRFLTVDFRPEIYSPFGMDWIDKNGLTSVILRHCPDSRACCRATRARLPPGDRYRLGPERKVWQTHPILPSGPAGLAVRPVIETISHRRTHRVSRGASWPRAR